MIKTDQDFAEQNMKSFFELTDKFTKLTLFVSNAKNYINQVWKIPALRV